MANSTGGDLPAHSRPAHTQAEETQAVDSRPDLGPEALVYIEKVRQATRRLAVRAVEPANIRQSLEALSDVAHFDVEVPTASARREVELLKTGVKRLSAWYMRYLSVQLNVFAARAVALGDALATRTERLESGSDDLAAHLGAVEERLRRLEAEAAARVADQPGRAPQAGPAPQAAYLPPAGPVPQAGPAPQAAYLPPAGPAHAGPVPHGRRSAQEGQPT